MQTTLLEEALQLLIFGMGTVYIFLILLVFAVNLMSRLIETHFPDPVPPETHPIKPRDIPSVDNTTLAVIHAAIRQHREKMARSAD